MTTTLKQLIADAEATNAKVSVADAIGMLGRDDVVFVDIRDPRELEREGTIPGAFRCTRGMLEFWIDKDSPYHKPIFDEPKTFVFYCAMGWRSALATKTASDLGLAGATDLAGGLKAWREAGGPMEAFAPRKEGG